MSEVLKCDQCGKIGPRNPQRNCDPVWIKVEAGLHYAYEQGYHFCSFVCLSAWADTMVPKELSK